ncbi:hypothetical protein NB2BOR_A44040 [Bordetella parapertussis]|nr:hypothetical protein NB2BOR_A44040 [Bordetella parapertussis]
MAGRRKVNDRQSPVAEADIAVNPMAFSIRPAMRDGIGHALQYRGVDRGTV